MAAPDQPSPRRAVRRQFYSIGEVCELFGLKAHVLRYWETQFDELSPPKNRAGNRVYRAEDIEQIALIRRLVHDERYTVEGARQRIGELRQAGEAGDESARALEASFVQMLRTELERLAALLEPGARTHEPDRPRAP